MTAPAATAAPSARAALLARWAPGLHTLLHYPRGALRHDVFAGVVLTALLVPVGMGYAEASGVPALYGLYATIVPLVAYALFGPTRIMVLGPDSTLAAVIAALIAPLAARGSGQAVALAGTLALMSGVFLLAISFLRLGAMADLFSKPIRLGFLNAISLTVVVGQTPKLLGFKVQGDGLPAQVSEIVHGIMAGRINPTALAIGLGALLTIVAFKRWMQRIPGVLVAVIGATLLSWWFDLHRTTGISVVGALPQGLPAFALPALGWHELSKLASGAAVIALLVFADTSVLSRVMATRLRERVNANQEMLALGAANISAGLFQGFPVSVSSSRTPVAEAAGARTQLAPLVGAALIALMLVAAPGLLKDLPSAALGAVVIVACLTLADWPGLFTLYRQRRVEAVLAMASFLGVAFVGVIEGIVIAIGLSLAVLVWNAWHPYSAVLARVDGRKGYHDTTRHPEGRHVPGLVIFRWDAELFFANAEIFRERLLRALESAPTPPRWVIVAADAITDVDITASEMLAALDVELEERGIELHFGGLKGVVKDAMRRYGLGPRFNAEHFSATVGSAVNLYRERHPVDWKDWDEV